mgnify:CR=1 FL=1
MGAILLLFMFVGDGFLRVMNLSDLSLQIAGNPADGPEIVRRQTGEQSFVMFHRDHEGRLVGASGIGPGNSIARDVKLAEMLDRKAHV